MFTPPNKSCVTCHVSHVTCHMSNVIFFLIYFFFFFFFLSFFLSFRTKWRSLSGEGLLSTGPTPSSFIRSQASFVRLSKVVLPFRPQKRKIKADSQLEKETQFVVWNKLKVSYLFRFKTFTFLSTKLKIVIMFTLKETSVPTMISVSPRIRLRNLV